MDKQRVAIRRVALSLSPGSSEEELPAPPIVGKFSQMKTLGGLLEVFGKSVRIRSSGELKLRQPSTRRISTQLIPADLKAVYTSLFD